MLRLAQVVDQTSDVTIVMSMLSIILWFSVVAYACVSQVVFWLAIVAAVLSGFELWNLVSIIIIAAHDNDSLSIAMM